MDGEARFTMPGPRLKLYFLAGFISRNPWLDTCRQRAEKTCAACITPVDVPSTQPANVVPLGHGMQHPRCLTFSLFKTFLYPLEWKTFFNSSHAPLSGSWSCSWAGISAGQAGRGRPKSKQRAKPGLQPKPKPDAARRCGYPVHANDLKWSEWLHQHPACTPDFV